MTIIKAENKNIKERLDVFLTTYFENKYPRNKVSSLIENGLILVNQKEQKTAYKLKLNDIIEFDENEIFDFLNENKPLEPLEIELDILYEDDDLIVINKPKNLLTHPTKFERKNTLANALIYHCGKNLSNIQEDRPGIVHRLDKNTAGLIVAAKTNFAHENLAGQIKVKSAKRKYLALAMGIFEKKEGIIDKPLVHYLKDNVKMTIAQDETGLEAITNYKVIKEFQNISLVELELKTGRTHQIRVHLSSIKHPVFGDELYGAKSFMTKEMQNIKTEQQLLQSYYLSFEHPRTKKRMNFQLEEKDFSKDFIKVLNFLRSKENERN